MPSTREEVERYGDLDPDWLLKVQLQNRIEVEWGWHGCVVRKLRISITMRQLSTR
jgi:hypothetical protein